MSGGSRAVEVFVKFTVSGASDYTGLTLNVLRDDGAVIYLNGNELRRENMPDGTIMFTSSRHGEMDEYNFSRSEVLYTCNADGTNIRRASVINKGWVSTCCMFGDLLNSPCRRLVCWP